MELAGVCKIRQFNIENLRTNRNLKQSKSMEISKDLVLILQIYHAYEKKGEKNLLCFLEKKKGKELTKDGIGPSSSGPLSSTMTMRHPLPSSRTVTMRHPLPSGGAAIGGLAPPLPPVGP
jgi:hypothetical protein